MIFDVGSVLFVKRKLYGRKETLTSDQDRIIIKKKKIMFNL